MRVLFLTVYYPPEVGAPQARTHETARRFVEWGHEVTVLTAFPNHPTGIVAEGYRGKLYMREKMDGVNLLRTWAYAAPNRGLWRWAAKHFSFAASSLLASPFAGSFDVVVVQSSALFLGLTASAIGLLRGVPWVLTVSDLWPETAVAQGQTSSRPLVSLTDRLAGFVYRRADALVGVTESICQTLVRRGVPAEKVSHIPNGTDTELFSPREERAPARTGLGLNGEFAVVYAGTIGLAQGLDIVLDTAKLLRGTPDVRFVLVGDGVEKPKLLERVRRERITNVTFVDRRPRSEMPALLNAADVVLVTLRKQPLFEGALPSKTSEAMACGRPVVMTIAGEAAAMLERAGAGLAVEPESPQALADAVLKVKQEPELAARMGRRGREFAVRELDRTALARRLEALLLDLVNAKAGTRSAA